MGTLTHCFPVVQSKFEILIRPGQGNLVGAAKPDQPIGDPWTGLSLICAQTVFLSFLVLQGG